LPTTTASAGTDFVTTAPAPIMAFSPIVMPGKITAPPPNRGTSFHYCLQKTWGIHLGSRKQIIGKSHVWPDENVILNSHSIPKLHATFNRDVVTNQHIIFNQHLSAYIAILTNLCSRKHHAKLPDARACTNISAFNISKGMNVFAELIT